MPGKTCCRIKIHILEAKFEGTDRKHSEEGYEMVRLLAEII